MCFLDNFNIMELLLFFLMGNNISKIRLICVYINILSIQITFKKKKLNLFRKQNQVRTQTIFINRKIVF